MAWAKQLGTGSEMTGVEGHEDTHIPSPGQHKECHTAEGKRKKHPILFETLHQKLSLL